MNNEIYQNLYAYFKKNPSEINSKRTNNWGNNKKKSEENKNNVNKKDNSINKKQDNRINKKNKGWLSEWL